MKGSNVRFGATCIGFALAASACGAGSEDVPSAPLADAAPPVTNGDVTHYPTPAETLFVRPLPDGPASPASLLFYRGRGVQQTADGVALVPDPQGSRVLRVGPDLGVTAIIGGPDAEDGGLGQPLATASSAAGGTFVADVEHASGLVYYDADGVYAGAARPPVSNPDLQTSPDGSLWAARTPYLLRFEETPLDAPLLYRFDPLEGTGVAIAAIEPVSAPAWNRAANAGPIAAGPDGNGYFAFFMRNELRAYDPNGALLWRTTRDVHFDTYEPVFVGEGEHLRYNVRPVTQALSFGVDGHLYALTAPDSTPDPMQPARAGATRRVEVYDRATGALLRASVVPAEWTTFAVGPEGRVYYLDPMRIDRTAPPPERPPVPDVPLVTFEGDTTRFADHRGKALLINFWASWCAPCQAELPKLAEYYPTLDRSRVEFLAISVDEDRAAGLDFIAPFEVPFPTFYAGPVMQEHFHYLGLPFTLVVDARGRIVEEIHGFGSEDTWNYLTEKLEAEMEAAAPSQDHSEHLDGASDSEDGHGNH